MKKYLLFFSYYGAPFYGVAKNPGFKTVHSTLTEALQTLKPKNDYYLTISSRTDAGVSAFCNSGTVDLQHRNEGFIYDPYAITHQLNFYLQRVKENVRVKETVCVPDSFHCRRDAKSRTYLYRISRPRNESATYLRNLFDEDCHKVHAPLDMGLVRAAAEVLDGEHDFRGFSFPGMIPHYQGTVKRLQVNIFPRTQVYEEYASSNNRPFDYWDLVFTSNGFLYRQVRVMVAFLLAAGTGKIDIALIRELLEDPTECKKKRKSEVHSVLSNIPPSSPLTLCGVQYDRNDFTEQHELLEEGSQLFNPIKYLQGNSKKLFKKLGERQFNKLVQENEMFDTESDVYRKMCTILRVEHLCINDTFNDMKSIQDNG